MVSLRADGLKIERVIWGEKIYIVPRNDGRILAGATVEYVGFDKQVTAGGIEKFCRPRSKSFRNLQTLASKKLGPVYAPIHLITCRFSARPTSMVW